MRWILKVPDISETNITDKYPDSYMRFNLEEAKQLLKKIAAAEPEKTALVLRCGNNQLKQLCVLAQYHQFQGATKEEQKLADLLLEWLSIYFSEDWSNKDLYKSKELREDIEEAEEAFKNLVVEFSRDLQPDPVNKQLLTTIKEHPDWFSTRPEVSPDEDDLPFAEELAWLMR